MTYARIESIAWDTIGQGRGQRGQCYVILNLWNTRPTRGEAPDEITDIGIALPPHDATDRRPLLINGKYQRQGGGEWTQAELDIEFANYHHGERTNPYGRLVYEVVEVDHRALILRELRRYVNQHSAGVRGGDRRDPGVITRNDDPVLDRPGVRELAGQGVDE